jgi:long-chain fatty acid transport protein
MDLSGSASFSQTPTGNPELDSLVAARLPAGDVALATAVEFPAIFSAGAAYAWNDWRAEFDVNWYQWSAFDRLVLEFESRPDLNQVIEEQYENVFQYRVGIERRLNDTWQVRGGYFFDKSPAPPESISPLLPDASRHGLALGGTWRSGGALRVDGALWGIFAGDRSTEGRNRDRFDGSYSSSAVTFGLFLGYSF